MNLLEDKYPSWSQLNRINAYIMRFHYNTRKHNIVNRKLGPLNVAELSNATTVLIRGSQSITFGQEIADLKDKRPVSNRSALRSLNPFIDNEGVIRVGGRLANFDI